MYLFNCHFDRGKIYLITCKIEDERCHKCQIIIFSCKNISKVVINTQVTFSLKILHQYLSTLLVNSMKDDRPNKDMQIVF